MNNAVMLVIFCVIILWALVVFATSMRKRKWYKLFLANNDILCVYRMSKDYWFNSVKDMVAFRFDNGRLVFITRRWILKAEQIEEAEVPLVQKQIQEMKEKQDEGEV